VRLVQRVTKMKALLFVGRDFPFGLEPEPMNEGSINHRTMRFLRVANRQNLYPTTVALSERA
jgi:hypothetical protein